MGKLTINKAGMSSTIQDLGRSGYQSKGVSGAGAMDQIALKLSNILVGNEITAPCIEMTLKGDTITFSEDTNLAICGGDFGFKINGKPVPVNTNIQVISGDQLSSGFARAGMRAYLAVKGGLNIKPVLGSCSTSVREKMGGLSGQKLKDGDEIAYNKSAPYLMARKVPVALVNSIYKPRVLSYTYSAEISRFTQEEVDRFSSGVYEITNQSDRMGYRLNGPLIKTQNGSDIISGPVNFGSIQVPGSGLPIIMMADRQTVGGYVKIGQVIQADLPLLAQSAPGQNIEFKQVSVEEAIEKWKKIHRDIESWKENLDKREVADGTSKKFNVNVGGKKYRIRVSEWE